MPAIEMPETLKGFSMFQDGVGHAGVLMSGQLPKLTLNMAEHRDGGMDGVTELDMGLQKMEATFGFADNRRPIIKSFGLLDGTSRMLTLRGSMESDTGVKRACIGTLGGRTKEIDPGTWNAKGGGGRGGDDAQLKSMMAVDYFRWEIDGEELIEIDVLNVVRRIGGVDQLEARRQALGL